MSYGNMSGPLGIDPLLFSLCLLGCLTLFVLYLLLPRGIRVNYFRGYPKRYAWAAKARRRRTNTQLSGGAPPIAPTLPSGPGGSAASSPYGNQRTGNQPLDPASSTGSNYSNSSRSRGLGNNNNQTTTTNSNTMEETVDFESGNAKSNNPMISGSNTNDEAVISSAMQQLRDPGVLIVAHGSRGKPKTVRLQLTENAITWRTETRKKNANGQYTKEIKLGKLHSVSLANIMYVDVGKQTTALRRVENSAVPETLCFSLLTKEGSLDLESNSPRERDALVSCFSLVLDEVHAQNWRDIYRGPSADMVSSFDEYDEEAVTGGQIPP